MVIKEVKNPPSDYFTRKAKIIKVLPLDIKLAHTRKCFEVNNALNFKKTVEKESKQDRLIYEKEFKKQKEKYERFNRRQKKKDLIIQGLV